LWQFDFPGENKAFMAKFYVIICIISRGSRTNYTYFCHTSGPKLNAKLKEGK